MTAKPIHPESTNTLDLAAGFRGRVRPVRKSPLYHAGLALTALMMVALPLLYIAVIGLMILGLGWYAVHGAALITTGGTGGARFRVFAYIAPLIVGVIGVLFMIKPLFAPRGAQPEPCTIARTDEPLLHAYVEMLCGLMGAPTPRRIDVTCDVNASASFRRGFRSMVGRDLVLTIGLPLVAGLDLRQLTGVLAHEFGHFAQGAGMRAGYVVARINTWFARVVYERDAWDEMLDDWAEESGHIAISLVVHLARLFVWCSRQVLRLLMYAGHGVSCFLSRQQEFDADSYEARVSGSASFAPTFDRIIELSASMSSATGELQHRWRARQLPDNIPALVLATDRSIPDDARSRLVQSARGRRTGLFDSHPSTSDRIRRVEKQNEPGIFSLDAPATALFKDFDAVCRRASYLHYRAILGESVMAATFIPTSGVIQDQRRDSDMHAAFDRFFHGTALFIRPITIGELPSVTDPRPVLASLKAARQGMAERFDDAVSASSRFDKADDRHMEVAGAAAVRDCGLRVIATRFHLPDASPDSIDRARQSADADQTAAAATLDPFLACTRERLTAALALLHAPGAEKKLPDLPLLQARAAQLLAFNRALGRLMPAALAIRPLQAAFVAVYKAPQTDKDRRLSGPRLGAIAGDLSGHLRTLHGGLESVPYPFENSTQVSTAQYVLESLPNPQDPGGTMTAADECFRGCINVYFRSLAELAGIALSVETALGLPSVGPSTKAVSP